MDLWSLHHQFLNDRFADRYIDPADWAQFCRSLPAPFRIASKGLSAKGRPIHHLEWGRGPFRVLLWSQMHGNEPTATLALSDLFLLLTEGWSPAHPLHEWLLKWNRRLTLHFVPMLNPDGAALFQRRNAHGIDLNRDAVRRHSPESRFFWDLIDQIQPGFCFNLHDQRSLFSAGHSDQPATISFLAPRPDPQRSISDARRLSMRMGGHLADVLHPHLGARIGRYTDEFYPTAFGDNLQSRGIANLLIESGESPLTPYREETRKANFTCLAAGLEALQSNGLSATLEASYLALPENRSRFFDLILEKVTWQGGPADIGLRAKEKLINGAVKKVYEVADMGDLQFAPRFKTVSLEGCDWKGSLTLEQEPDAQFTWPDGSVRQINRFGGDLI